MGEQEAEDMEEDQPVLEQQDATMDEQLLPVSVSGSLHLPRIPALVGQCPAQ